MQKTVRKQLNIIKTNNLPFKYELKILREDEESELITVSESTYSRTDSIYVKLWISKENCISSGLQYDYYDELYFDIPPDYPFRPPKISFMDSKLKHPMLFRDKYDDYYLNLCDWACFMNISQIIIHAGVILTEALNNPENAEEVKQWNSYVYLQSLEDRLASLEDRLANLESRLPCL